MSEQPDTGKDKAVASSGEADTDRLWKHPPEAALEEDEAWQARCSRDAAFYWSGYEAATPEHPFFKKHRVPTFGAKAFYGAAVIPVPNAEGGFQSLCFVSPDWPEAKEEPIRRFYRGAKIDGGRYWLLEDKSKPLTVSRDFLSGARLAAEGKPVVVAFTARNVGIIAKEMREKFPSREVVECV